MEELTSAEADSLAYGGGGPFTGEDAAVAGELCRAVFERAAKCVCANLSAILVLTDTGSDPEHPTCVCADGSVIRYAGPSPPAWTPSWRASPPECWAATASYARRRRPPPSAARPPRL